MDEMTMFARLRPDDTLSETDLADLRAELFPDLGVVAHRTDSSATHPTPRRVDDSHETPDVPARRRRAHFVVAAAAAVALMGGSGLWLAFDRRDGSGPTAPATQPDPTPTPVRPTPVTGPAALFSAPAADIEWSAIAPDPSIAGAIVESMATGPGGFVAVGSRALDGSASADGHVWFSPDGTQWASFADDLFRNRTPRIVAATSTAYFVVAPPPLPGDRQPDLFRSYDGQNWEPIGPPDTSFGDLVVIDDTLFAVDQTVLDNGDVTLIAQSSPDGANWTPLTSEDARTALALDPQVLNTAGRWFIASLEPRREATPRPWGITVREWNGDDLASTPPSPTIYGRLAPTSSGLALLGTTDPADDCAPAAAEPDSDGPLVDWEICRYDLTLDGWDLNDAAWRRIGSLDTATPSPDAGLWTFGNQLVAAVQRPDAGLAVWTSVNGTTWTNPFNSDPIDPTVLADIGPTGFTLGASNDTTILIPVTGPELAGLQHIVVGHIKPR